MNRFSSLLIDESPSDSVREPHDKYLFASLSETLLSADCRLQFSELAPAFDLDSEGCDDCSVTLEGLVLRRLLRFLERFRRR